jgi:hypothetical protein
MSRIAVYLPSGHAEHGDPDNPEPALTVYRLGRIEEGVHNAPAGFAPIPYGEFVERLLEDAKREYPDAQVRVERIVDNGDGTSSWIPADEFDPAVHKSTIAGQSRQAEVTVTNGQQTGA